MFKTKLATLTLAATLLATSAFPFAAQAAQAGEGSTTANFTLNKGVGRLTLDQAPDMNFEAVNLADVIANDNTSSYLKGSGSRSAEPTVNRLKITDSRDDETNPTWSLNANMTNFGDNTHTINANQIEMGKLTYDGSATVQTSSPIKKGVDSVVLTSADPSANAAAKAGKAMGLTTNTQLFLGRTSGLPANVEGDFNATVNWTLTDSIS